MAWVMGVGFLWGVVVGGWMMAVGVNNLGDGSGLGALWLS